jgi:hypothetical protein
VSPVTVPSSSTSFLHSHNGTIETAIIPESTKHPQPFIMHLAFHASLATGLVVFVIIPVSGLSVKLFPPAYYLSGCETWQHGKIAGRANSLSGGCKVRTISFIRRGPFTDTVRTDMACTGKGALSDLRDGN